MSAAIHLSYKVDGSDFTGAGTASAAMKRILREIGVDMDTIRRCAICMYEGEINMVIHANGGTADIYIDTEGVKMVLKDNGPGIADIDQAMQEGFSTAKEGVRDLGFGAGMGLPNMKKYSDEMIIDTEVGKGTKVTLIVRFPKSGGDGA